MFRWITLKFWFFFKDVACYCSTSPLWIIEIEYELPNITWQTAEIEFQSIPCQPKAWVDQIKFLSNSIDNCICITSLLENICEPNCPKKLLSKCSSSCNHTVPHLSVSVVLVHYRLEVYKRASIRRCYQFTFCMSSGLILSFL